MTRNLTRDHLLSIREVTDSGASLHARYEYGPFGSVAKLAGTSPDLLAFTGVPVHGPSDLLLMKRRAYDPALARWLSEDPLGRIDGPNLYAYVVNQPLRWVDPLGTFIVKPHPTSPNGNVIPGFQPQRERPVCDVPGFMGWEGKMCVLQCCKSHDAERQLHLRGDLPARRHHGGRDGHDQLAIATTPPGSRGRGRWRVWTGRSPTTRSPTATTNSGGSRRGRSTVQPTR